MPSTRPLNLIWPRQRLDAILEGHFIRHVLLGNLGRPVRLLAAEMNALSFVDDALFVCFETEHADYFCEARAQGIRNLGLLHMADEQGKNDRSFYALADYVLRHYWFEDALKRPSPQSLGVMWIPNGYRTGVGPVAPNTMLGIAERTIMGFFSGVVRGHQLTDERAVMFDTIMQAKLPFLLCETPHFGEGLGPVSYASYLGNARFAPVPTGNSPETIRLYDVLECGAIPIMRRSAFTGETGPLGKPPFLFVDSWWDVPALYAPYADSNNPSVIEELEAKRRACVAWWTDFKALQQRKVRELIDRSFDRHA